MQNTSTKIQTCPNCENILQVNEGFTTWCEKCDWNLSQIEIDPPRNIFQSFYRSFNKKQGKALFDSLVNANPKDLKPSLSLTTIFAFAIATLVYLLPLVFLVLGVWLLSKSLESIFLLPIALILLLLAWVTKPQFSRMPLNILSKKDFPVLYDFVNSIAKSLETENIDTIVFDQNFNASYGQVGWKNKKVLTIGLPLWTILSMEEKVALVSHELSHGINGDIKRGVFVGGALYSLVELYNLVHPDAMLETENITASLLFLPFNILLLVLSYIILLVIYIFAYLLFFDSQKAEYLADYLATKVSGTEAKINLLNKNQMGFGRFEFILERFSLRQEKFDLFKILKKDFESIPHQEKERIKRLSNLEELRLDETHPPTIYRIKFLEHHFEKGMKISISEEQKQLLDAEISTVKDRIQSDALDYYRFGLYY